MSESLEWMLVRVPAWARTRLCFSVCLWLSVSPSLSFQCFSLPLCLSLAGCLWLSVFPSLSLYFSLYLCQSVSLFLSKSLSVCLSLFLVWSPRLYLHSVFQMTLWMHVWLFSCLFVIYVCPLCSFCLCLSLFLRIIFICFHTLVIRCSTTLCLPSCLYGCLSIYISLSLSD